MLQDLIYFAEKNEIKDAKLYIDNFQLFTFILDYQLYFNVD